MPRDADRHPLRSLGCARSPISRLERKPAQMSNALLGVLTMAQDEKQELDRLCLAVIHEKDPAKLTERVAELNAFLARRDAKLAPPTKPATQS
jgi:hypothetical protein